MAQARNQTQMAQPKNVFFKNKQFTGIKHGLAFKEEVFVTVCL